MLFDFGEYIDHLVRDNKQGIPPQMWASHGFKLLLNTKRHTQRRLTEAFVIMNFILVTNNAHKVIICDAFVAIKFNRRHRLKRFVNGFEHRDLTEAITETLSLTSVLIKMLKASVSESVLTTIY